MGSTDSSGCSGDMMREDMISNALIWFMSMLINFIAAGDSFVSAPAGHRPDCAKTTEAETGIQFGINQKTLLER